MKITRYYNLISGFMKIVFVLLMIICQLMHLNAQSTDSIIPLNPEVSPFVLTDISNPAYKLGSAVIHFRNDSLSVPDSLMQRYDKVFWIEDTNGICPSYMKEMPNGWSISWPEGYSDGGFHFRVYKNYLVAWIGHDNPNPNRLLYIQAIDRHQFEQISFLMVNDCLSKTVVKHGYTDKYGHFINFGLNHKRLGLYDLLELPGSEGYNDTVAMEKAEAQFYTGLSGAIKVFNKHLAKKIPEPGDLYKHCYNHFIWHDYFNGDMRRLLTK
jgi:hypothetical protein